MTANIEPNTTKRLNSPLWLSIILIVLGIVAIALPNISTLVTETWVALILISAGGAKLGYAFQTRDRGGLLWQVLLAILYVATGILLFSAPLTGVLTLTLLLGSFLLTEGVFESILAFRLRPQANWSWLLINGVVTFLLGLMIWFQWPFNAPWLIGTLIGVSVLFTGISRLSFSLQQPKLPGDSSQQSA
ncbi:DUF308 domain-containing protein [Oscillatoria sp. FACHB-1406]|uniref:HdeD family acid-resistance protein n=1 Tax=Oscillatoria sp. FACHB-1406 TaxID=2692846 RepID=UPI0016854BFE|nr:DUF308 domain-containing protein [Oscillatoria sp. FACHB-1406]MBD2576795.1 DUF308 domain-containing protein [Oscillatoria sp. FACHB-1406]